MLRVYGYRVRSLEGWVQRCGCRLQCLEGRVQGQGSRARVQGLFRVWGVNREPPNAIGVSCFVELRYLIQPSAS